jgi:hypothetical protein
MTIISFSSPQDRVGKPVWIVATNGGKCWKIFPPGASYTMQDRRTKRGAIAFAERTYPGIAIEVRELTP